MSNAQAVLSELEGENYISLETFRKNGTGVKTPVWHVREGDRLFVFTNGKSYKVKRLRRNTDCRVARCDVRGGSLGTFYDGKCVIVEGDAAKEDLAYKSLRRKYGIQMIAITVAAWFGRKKRDWVVLEITFDD